MSDKTTRMTLDDITRYREVFKAPPPIDFIGSFDIVKFDDILHKRHGYTEEEHGSIRDFLTLKYSNEFCVFIEGLIHKYYVFSELEDCAVCKGSGEDPNGGGPCCICSGTGKYEV